MIPSRVRATVRDYIRAHEILRPGPVVVAVSGGPDSTALLLILAGLADELGLVLHVAHFDHRTRPRQSALDADFVAKLANRVGAPIRIGRAARATKSEDDARRARYEFLRRAASEIGAATIATGHTRDDQAETVLLHLARGSGIAGLAGMRPLRDGIARPLLSIGRGDTAAVCRAARIRPRSDPTNRSLRFARNRVRHRVLPELARLNPRVVEAIARLADASADVATGDDARADDALRRATEPDAIGLEALADDRLRAEVLAAAWRRATGRTLAARHRDALTKLTATTNGSRSLDLPGGRAVREYATFRIETALRAADGVADPVTLEPGRHLTWNEWGLVLGDGALPEVVAVARVPKTLVGRLVVRPRRTGDRTLGASGKKLQDVFTDAKVPAAIRAKWPVLAIDDAVWWVPGLTAPPQTEGGTRLAVAAPKQMGNVRWGPRVREVASKAEAAARRPRRGPPN